MLQITKLLSEGQVIKNWTYLKGYIGEDLTIIKILQSSIIVKPASAMERTISNKEFENFSNLWNDYKDGKIKRSMLPDSRNSKYIIGILHFCEKQSQEL